MDSSIPATIHATLRLIVEISSFLSLSVAFALRELIRKNSRVRLGLLCHAVASICIICTALDPSWEDRWGSEVEILSRLVAGSGLWPEIPPTTLARRRSSRAKSSALHRVCQDSFTDRRPKLLEPSEYASSSLRHHDEPSSRQDTAEKILSMFAESESENTHIIRSREKSSHAKTAAAAGHSKRGRPRHLWDQFQGSDLRLQARYRLALRVRSRTSKAPAKFSFSDGHITRSVSAVSERAASTAEFGTAGQHAGCSGFHARKEIGWIDAYPTAT